MNTKSEIETPKNKLRSLGLRRSTPKVTLNKTPLSDVKINYKSLISENTAETSSPFTPKVTKTSSSTACSTNCLPYRLSLSRTVREKYKKKKLEFSIDNNPVESETAPKSEEEEVIDKEKLFQKHQKHKEQVKELKNEIAIWTEAFKVSLEELSSKIEPKMEVEDLIARLGLPPDMIDYT